MSTRFVAWRAPSAKRCAASAIRRCASPPCRFTIPFVRTCPSIRPPRRSDTSVSAAASPRSRARPNSAFAMPSDLSNAPTHSQSLR
ncbi:Uncharacterised protein [Burkholderia pseudomallei]|nr:hypothetical protein X962_5158 [Burkholderia pseudomallei MSHR7343]KGS54824.1 hypothetical protein X949_5029 [Burkholderia pseudomallei MSHR5609]KOS89571.1 hypothetical protein DM53_3554 [Burkholderia mallei]CAJ3002811.1 Uncharacterised protein [Burkholderia pseudomallei]CAJ3055790.1 Uncharacterised protein [Burkholderia pseudomallei]